MPTSLLIAPGLRTIQFLLNVNVSSETCVKHVSKMCKVQGEKFNLFPFGPSCPIWATEWSDCAALSLLFSPFLCNAGRLLAIDTTIEGNLFLPNTCRIECIYLKSGKKNVKIVLVCHCITAAPQVTTLE